MKTEPRSTLQTNQSGFSRTELVVVLFGVIGVIAMLTLAVAVGVEKSRRSQCRNNLRQIYTALSLYASDNQGLLPDCTMANPKFAGSVWPWDVNANVVAELERRGAVRKVLYCPSNQALNTEPHWDFPTYFNAPCRVLGYAFLLDGCRQIPSDMGRVDLKGEGKRKPGEVELVVDATLSQFGNYAHIGGLNVDRSNHLFFKKPAGGNILFEDGHAAWRPFSEMKHQIYGQAVWDF